MEQYQLIYKENNRSFFRASLCYLEKRITNCYKAQRPIDYTHVETLTHIINKQNQLTPMILACINKQSDVYYLIDGQHRYEAYKKSNYKNLLDCYLYEFNSITETDEFFITINETTLPMPKSIYKPETERDALHTLAKHVEHKYRPFIVTSKQPRFPHFKLTDFTDNINKLPFYNESTKDNIVDLFEKYNDKCKKEMEDKNDYRLKLINEKSTQSRFNSKIHGLFYLTDELL